MSYLVLWPHALVRRCSKNFFKFWWMGQRIRVWMRSRLAVICYARPQVVHVQALSLLSVSHANSAIIRAFAIINEQRMKSTLLTFTRPYCRKMAQIFGRSGAQNLIPTPSAIKLMSVLIAHLLLAALWNIFLLFAQIRMYSSKIRMLKIKR